MPDWCGNRLRVLGAAEQLDALRAALKGAADTGEPKAISFESVLPTPEELLQGGNFWETAQGKAIRETLTDAAADGDSVTRLMKQYPLLPAMLMAGNPEEGEAGWYLWRLANWGTKWDAASESTVEVDGHTLEAFFATAWSPPIPLLETLASRFPDLDFALTYEESSAGLAGFVRWQGGVRVEERESSELDECLAVLDESWPEAATDWRASLAER